MRFATSLKWPDLSGRLFSILKTIAIMFAVVYAVNWYQTRNLPDRIGDLMITDTGSTPVSTRRLIGEKPVALLYIFAPWCGVCKLTLPTLEAVRKAHGHVEVIPLALGFESKAEVDAMVGAAGYTGTYYYGTDQIGEILQIQAFPTMMFLSRDGSVRAAALGYSTRLGISARLIWAGLF
jgi:thiol-disulfide isomerase/thioredoxin